MAESILTRTVEDSVRKSRNHGRVNHLKQLNTIANCCVPFWKLHRGLGRTKREWLPARLRLNQLTVTLRPCSLAEGKRAKTCSVVILAISSGSIDIKRSAGVRTHCTARKRNVIGPTTHSAVIRVRHRRETSPQDKALMSHTLHIKKL